ncbi:MAG: AbrB/MazE/SpoVT family DNA-binding domain-containing protein [Brachymonas sp.]|nr:AbrB/MazE/SpoVT family DNA-binding domain-containing protein [Brachymonas sp.]
MNARLPSSITPTTAQKDSTVFTSGNSQAVRIPKEFQFNTKQVTIVKRGNELIVKPKHRTTAEILANLPPLDPNDLHEWEAFDQTLRELRQEPAQERDWKALFGDEASDTSRAAKQPKSKKEAPSRKVAKA